VRLAAGEIITLRATTTLAQRLSVRGTLRLDGALTRLTLTPVAKNGQPYVGRSITVYDKVRGCDTLHMDCRYTPDDTCQSGDTITYLLSVRAGEANKQIRTLAVALLEISIE
jgi:hypothetical protein